MQPSTQNPGTTPQGPNRGFGVYSGMGRIVYPKPKNPYAGDKLPSSSLPEAWLQARHGHGFAVLLGSELCTTQLPPPCKSRFLVTAPGVCSRVGLGGGLANVNRHGKHSMEQYRSLRQPSVVPRLQNGNCQLAKLSKNPRSINKPVFYDPHLYVLVYRSDMVLHTDG